jgi:hypothetical protein
MIDGNLMNEILGEIKVRAGSAPEDESAMLQEVYDLTFGIWNVILGALVREEKPAGVVFALSGNEFNTIVHYAVFSGATLYPSGEVVEGPFEEVIAKSWLGDVSRAWQARAAA